MEIIEYIRKSGRKANRDADGNIITKGCGIGRMKKGVMWCGISDSDNNKVSVGFSLCNPNDKFDHVNGNYEHGFGLGLAILRADKWINHTGYFLQKTWEENELYESSDIFLLENPRPKELVEIPPSINKTLFKFLVRCKGYYKDKEFPAWTEAVLNGEPTHVDGMDTRVYY